MADAANPFGSGGSTMKFGRIGALYVILHPSSDPSPDEWKASLDDGKRELASIRGVFVYSAGGGPNADQRKRLAEFYAANPLLSLLAVVTNSATARAIATGLNWFLKHPFRLFSPDELELAFTHVRASSAEQTAISALLQQHAEWLSLKMRPA